ncbi:MAG TPA: hypothetical protein VNE21_00165 [Mycobacteriales bacterium]|nr:hypothetical protein [Mycobacteriales bacterium]
MSDAILAVIVVLLAAAGYTALAPDYGRRRRPVRGYVLPVLLFALGVALLVLRLIEVL